MPAESGVGRTGTQAWWRARAFAVAGRLKDHDEARLSGEVVISGMAMYKAPVRHGCRRSRSGALFIRRREGIAKNNRMAQHASARR